MVDFSCPSFASLSLPAKRVDYLLEACRASNAGCTVGRSSFHELKKAPFFGRVLKFRSRIGTFHFAECPLRRSEVSITNEAREVFLSRVSNHSGFNFHLLLNGKRAEGKPFTRFPQGKANGRNFSADNKYPDCPDKFSKRKKEEVQSLESSSGKGPPSFSQGIQNPQPTVLKTYLFHKLYKVSDDGFIQPLPNGSLPLLPEVFYQDSQISSMFFWHAFPLYILWVTLKCPLKLMHFVLYNYPVRKADCEQFSRIYTKDWTGPNSQDVRLGILTKAISKHVPGTWFFFRASPVRLSLYASECYEILATSASLQLSKILPILGTGFGRKSPHNSIQVAIAGWMARVGENHGPSFISLVGAGYWLQGFRCFPWLAVNFYFKDRLQVDPGTLQFLQTTVNLPFLAKPIYGIVSDAIYIHGAHRLPYLIIAGVLQALSWGSILLHPTARSSVGLFAAILTFSNVGAAIAEVANDALVAESGKKKGSIPGELQSFAWLSSAFGSLLGCLLASFVLNKVEFEVIFFIFLVLLVFQLLNCISASEQSFGLRYIMVPGSQNKKGNLEREEMYYQSATMNFCDQESKGLPFSKGKDVHIRKWDVDSDENKISRTGHTSLTSQVKVLLKLVKKQEILHPLIWFMGSYAVIPTLGGSIFYYQSEFLKINASFLGLAKMVGQVGLLAGSLAYNKVLKDIPLRKLVVCVQVLLSVCMLSDLVLVKRVNLQLGIPDEYYVLGASALVDAINQFKILPFMVLLAKLCPSGSEGSLFAFFMSCLCFASILSGYFGTALASCLHISSDNFTQLPIGIFIQSMAALLPILWVRYVPDDTKAVVERKVESVL